MQIFIPARTADAIVSPHQTRMMSQRCRAGSPIGGQTMSTRKIQSVLYVDNDRNICEVAQATLRLIAGLTVHTAHSGQQAIDLAYELRPDIILMDVMMPGLDGPATLK